MWKQDETRSHLPPAKGPFLPGCMDIMTEYSIDGLFIRLYYPTESKGDIKSHFVKWIPWCPDISYIYGFSKVLLVFPLLVRLVVWLKSGYIHIPTLYGEKVNTNHKLKPIIFSHGLGGNRFLYSAICNEMASRGYLVVMIEHRDRSASNTYYYKSKEDAESNLRTEIRFRKIDFGKGHYEKRNEQIHKRYEDCDKAVNFLLQLNAGNVPYNVLNDVSTDKEIHFRLEDLIGNIDVDNITMCGHSFGGATALLAMSKRKELKQGILLDPWMFPIKDEKQILEISRPLIFINTQTFHILSNVQAMEKLLNSDERIMYTILGTTHENQTDSVFVAGYWLNWFMPKIDPEKAMDINNYLILKFLRNYAPTTASIDDCEEFLQNEEDHFVEGLTKPWA